MVFSWTLSKVSSKRRTYLNADENNEVERDPDVDGVHLVTPWFVASENVPDLKPEPETEAGVHRVDQKKSQKSVVVVDLGEKGQGCDGGDQVETC